MKKILFSLVATTAMLSFSTAFANPAMKAAKADATSAITSGCSAEITKFNCGADKVGTGLMKCLAPHHHDFSPSCKTAMQSAHGEMHAAKGGMAPTTATAPTTGTAPAAGGTGTN